jgi:hypothetical protein
VPPFAPSSIRGYRINVGPINLTSIAPIGFIFLRLLCFPDERNHPHIVAAGATFLQGSKIVVEAKAEKDQVGK